MTQAYATALVIVLRAKEAMQELIEHSEDFYEMNAIDSYLSSLIEIEESINLDSRGKKVSIQLPLE